ncbi:MAG TPA: head GIN domain-containing protein [Chitinophagaceae bacterium]|nr:head GIN domain-containing protein [Chitinophagaceae bacterium]
MDIPKTIGSCLVLSACAVYPIRSQAQQGRVDGDGHMTTVNRAVQPFHNIDFTGSFDVVILPGNNPSVRIEGEDNIIADIVTDVEGDNLRIGTKPQISIHPTKSLKVYVTAPGLAQIHSAGSGGLSSDGELKGDHMEVSLAGSGNVDLKLHANDLTAKLQGSGDLKVAMEVSGDFHANLVGSGDLDASGTADRADLALVGSGDISARKLSAKGWDTKILGSGNISR